MHKKERILLKAVNEKGQVTYKGRPIRIRPDFSLKTIKARRSWADVIQTLREHKCFPRLLYLANFSITLEGETKIFHDKKKQTNKQQKTNKKATTTTIKVTISFHKSSPTKDNRCKTPTQGKKIYPEKSKKIIVFQQTQKKIGIQT